MSSSSNTFAPKTPKQLKARLDSAENKPAATDIDGSTLPTSDPNVAGKLWNDAGTVKVSAGS
jgi:hypothetical protein